MRSLVLLAVSALLAACSAPVGVNRLTPREQQRELAASALTTDRPSDAAQIVLRRYNLAATFEDQPVLALETLRATALAGGPRADDLFALAELCYRYADESDSQPYALAASLYAYAFLFPDDLATRPAPIDARVRWAADIYAAGLSRALANEDGTALVLKSNVLTLPWGTLEVSVDTAEMAWSGAKQHCFGSGTFSTRRSRPGRGRALS